MNDLDIDQSLKELNQHATNYAKHFKLCLQQLIYNHPGKALAFAITAIAYLLDAISQELLDQLSTFNINNPN